MVCFSTAGEFTIQKEDKAILTEAKVSNIPAEKGKNGPCQDIKPQEVGIHRKHHSDPCLNVFYSGRHSQPPLLAPRLDEGDPRCLYH